MTGSHPITGSSLRHRLLSAAIDMRHDARLVAEADAVARDVGGRFDVDDERRFIAGRQSHEIDVGAGAGDKRALLIEQEHDRGQLVDAGARYRIAHQTGHRQARAAPFVAQRHELERAASAGRRRRPVDAAAIAEDGPIAAGDDTDEQHACRDGQASLPTAARRGHGAAEEPIANRPVAKRAAPESAYRDGWSALACPTESRPLRGHRDARRTPRSRSRRRHSLAPRVRRLQVGVGRDTSRRLGTHVGDLARVAARSAARTRVCRRSTAAAQCRDTSRASRAFVARQAPRRRAHHECDDQRDDSDSEQKMSMAIST